MDIRSLIEKLTQIAESPVRQRANDAFSELDAEVGQMNSQPQQASPGNDDFPKPGDPDYAEFQAWLKSPEGRAAAASMQQKGQSAQPAAQPAVSQQKANGPLSVSNRQQQTTQTPTGTKTTTTGTMSGAIDRKDPKWIAIYNKHKGSQAGDAFARQQADLEYRVSYLTQSLDNEDELVGEDYEEIPECGMMSSMSSMEPPKQQDSVSMNVNMSGQGPGGIRDLIDVLRNIESSASEKGSDTIDMPFVVKKPSVDIKNKLIDSDEGLANAPNETEFGMMDSPGVDPGMRNVHYAQPTKPTMESLISKLEQRYNEIKEGK